MTEQLKPCPFCGKSDTFVEREDFLSAYVMCNACGARGAVACQESDDEELPGENAAKVLWNTRQAVNSYPEMRGLLERLVDAKALSGVRKMVAGWNGEGRAEGPFDPHPSTLGAWLETNCGAMYELDELLECIRKSLAADREVKDAISIDHRAN